MKKVLSFFIIGLALYTAGECRAESPLKRAFQIGPEIYRYTYAEDSLDVKDQGMMYGAEASLAYHQAWMIRAEGRGAIGDVDYSSGSTGSANNIEDYTLEGRILGGYDFIDEDTRLYTAYTGFGYRFLHDAGAGVVTTTGALGYDRESNYYYLPIGFEGNKTYSDGWNLGGYFEFDILLGGVQDSLLSTAISTIGDVSNDQNGGWGVRGAVKIQKTGQKFDFVIQPFVRLWRIEQSEVSIITVSGVKAGYGTEPRNSTNEWGINFSLLF